MMSDEAGWDRNAECFALLRWIQASSPAVRQLWAFPFFRFTCTTVLHSREFFLHSRFVWIEKNRKKMN
jgi:hypothetical protein